MAKPTSTTESKYLWLLREHQWNWSPRPAYTRNQRWWYGYREASPWKRTIKKKSAPEDKRGISRARRRVDTRVAREELARYWVEGAEGTAETREG